MRIAGYILAIIVGVAATIVGFVLKVWPLAGFGLGFLAISIYRISVGGQSKVGGQNKYILSIFDMPLWPDGVICIVILVVAEVVAFLIFKLLGWA